MYLRATLTKYGLAFCGVIMILFSCQDNFNDELSVVKESLPTSDYVPQSPKDLLASRVAISLANSLQELEVRSFVKEQALKRFDGDYNFLIEMSKNETLSTNSNGRIVSRSFGDLLAGSDISGSSRTSVNEFLESLSSQHPYLQIAVPSLQSGNAESWDENGHIPMVAFIPSDFDDHDPDATIPAFDVDGNQYALSAIQEPSELVVVVSENERIMVFNKEAISSSGRTEAFPIYDDCFIMQEPLYENDENLYFSRSEVFEEINGCTGGGGGGGGGGTGGGGSGGTTTCDRDRKSGKDRLHRMIFNSMGDFRDANEWFDGGQDLEVTITFGRANGSIASVTKSFSGKDKDFKDCGLFNCDPEWFSLGGAEVVTWDKDVYGNAMLYSWVEKDGGDPVELNNSFTSSFDNDDGTKSSVTFGVKTTIQDKDDRLYESVVEYCDNTDGDGYTYNTGKIKFQVRQ